MDTARSFLFVTWEGGGNVPPVLGTARRLVQRGHRVRILAEPCMAEAVGEAGADFIPFTEHFTRTDRHDVLMHDWQASSPPAAIKKTLKEVIAGPAEAVARQTVAVLDAERTDVLVADWLMPGALIAAEARGVPAAVLLHCIDMRPGPGKPGPGMHSAHGSLGRLRDRLLRSLMHRTADSWLPTFNAARSSFGLPSLDHLFDAYDRADRVLVQTCRAFDFPITPAPDNVRYVGPVLDEPDWVAETVWENPWSESDTRPLVVASLSSTFQNQRAVLQEAIVAFGRLNVRGLVTLGPAMRNEAFEVPANVRIVESVPHGAVFPHADAFVTHCGHGSVMRALSHGVPLVALPMGRDQDDTAVRIVERGLGLRSKPRAVSIAAAVRRVLEEPSFRAAAEQMARAIHTDAEADRCVEEVECLAYSGRDSLAYSGRDKRVVHPTNVSA